MSVFLPPAIWEIYIAPPRNPFGGAPSPTTGRKVEFEELEQRRVFMGGVPAGVMG